jgi:hypothetical protein
MPSRLRFTLVALTVTGAGGAVARADCPTSVSDLPATGIVAAIARTAMEEYTNITTPPPPKLAVEATAAGGVLADADDSGGTASIGAMGSAHYKGFGACASGDLVDVRTNATHVTGSAQIPFMFTGISFGGTVDREVRVPLATRAELFRAPVSRVATQVSAAFIDMEVADEHQRARVLAMPFTFERAATTQDDGVTLSRYTTTARVAMFRVIGTDATGTGEFTFGDFRITSTSASSDPMAPPLVGLIGMSFLHIAGTVNQWSMDIDGGILALDGPEDCNQCERGFYTLALGHRWDQIAVNGRVERTAFVATNDEAAIEDRATANVELGAGKRRLVTSAFLARTASYLGPARGTTAGARVTASQELKAGFSAVVDGELVGSRGNIPSAADMPVPSEASRVLLSLAWQRRATR